MRHGMWIVSAVLALTTHAGPLAAQGGRAGAAKSLADLAWMAGSWVSTDGAKTTEEHWTKPAGGIMLGLHRDVEGAKTAFEFLRIEEKAGKITYLAMPQGRPGDAVRAGRELGAESGLRQSRARLPAAHPLLARRRVVVRRGRGSDERRDGERALVLAARGASY